jgi:hypothetical protein
LIRSHNEDDKACSERQLSKLTVPTDAQAPSPWDITTSSMGETNPVSGEALTKSVQGVLQLESGSVARLKEILR